MNDYLARRDSEWVGQVHRFLGLRVGLVQQGLSEAERKAAYRADITYVTNSELGFDYLRDNLAQARACPLVVQSGSGGRCSEGRGCGEWTRQQLYSGLQRSLSCVVLASTAARRAQGQCIGGEGGVLGCCGACSNHSRCFWVQHCSKSTRTRNRNRKLPSKVSVLGRAMKRPA